MIMKSHPKEETHHHTNTETLIKSCKSIDFSTSEQVRLPAEFKHITKRRKRN
jgi:hypothetical protein